MEEGGCWRTGIPNFLFLPPLPPPGAAFARGTMTYGKLRTDWKWAWRAGRGVLSVLGPNIVCLDNEEGGPRVG